jgi:hypothetical protein
MRDNWTKIAQYLIKCKKWERAVKRSDERDEMRERYRIIRSRKYNIRRIEIREIVAVLEDQGVECPGL